jgi:mono/diheme cytochrome c family protein
MSSTTASRSASWCRSASTVHLALSLLSWAPALVLAGAPEGEAAPAKSAPGSAPSSAPSAAPSSAPSTAEVLGLFSRRCVECHGPAKRSGKLRLDSLDSVFRGGKSGPAVVAGKSAESILYRRIAPGAEEPMPPPDEARPLAAEEVDLVRLWIDSGARAGAAAAAGAGAQTAASPAPALEGRSLPGDFRALFAFAGDPSAPRLALGRGPTVEVWRCADGPEEERKEKADKKEKENEKAAKDGAARAGLERAALLDGPRDVVQSLAFSRDGKLLAAGEFARVHVWETAGFSPVRVLAPHADRVLALAVSPDGKRLAAGSGLPTVSGEVKVWDLESGEEVWSSGAHTDTVFGLDWSADGTAILTGGADRVTYVLEAATGKELRRFEGHTHHVLAVAFSPDGKTAATAGADRLIRLWDLENGRAFERSLSGHRDAVTSVAFHDGGKQVASASGDGTVRFWQVPNGQERRSFTEAKGYLQGGGFLLGGKWYAAAEGDGTVRVYEAAKNTVLFTIEPQS